MDFSKLNIVDVDVQKRYLVVKDDLSKDSLKDPCCLRKVMLTNEDRKSFNEYLNNIFKNEKNPNKRMAAFEWMDSDRITLLRMTREERLAEIEYTKQLIECAIKNNMHELVSYYQDKIDDLDF